MEYFPKIYTFIYPLNNPSNNKKACYILNYIYIYIIHAVLTFSFLSN